MVVNIWSKYNTEQFPALYTRGDLTFFPIWIQFKHFISCWNVELRVWSLGTESLHKSKSPRPPSNHNLEKKLSFKCDFWTRCLSPAWSLLLLHAFNLRLAAPQAKKTTKMMKKTTRTRKILIISQRLEETDWKYLRISMCAASTFSWVSSTFASILEQSEKAGSTTFGIPNCCSLLLILVAVFQSIESIRSF